MVFSEADSQGFRGDANVYEVEKYVVDHVYNRTRGRHISVPGVCVAEAACHTEGGVRVQWEVGASDLQQSCPLTHVFVLECSGHLQGQASEDVGGMGWG